MRIRHEILRKSIAILTVFLFRLYLCYCFICQFGWINTVHIRLSSFIYFSNDYSVFQQRIREYLSKIHCFRTRHSDDSWYIKDFHTYSTLNQFVVLFFKVNTNFPEIKFTVSKFAIKSLLNGVEKLLNFLLTTWININYLHNF